MKIATTKEVANILGVSVIRVRHLLAQNRIKGAYKKGKLWCIPLNKGKPTITAGKRGPKPRWLARRPRPTKKIVHVNRNAICRNRKHNIQTPVISIKTGKTDTYAKEVAIAGPCRIIYNPDRPKPCGAVVWIETYSEVKIFN